jgi:Membrane domain of glycerophosphoryl diester phosphodiesterase
MTDLAVTRTARRAELDANLVLKQAWRLYKRLFARSVLMGATVLGAMHLVQALASSGRSGAVVPLLALALGVGGIALLQGGLVEIVRGLHADGDDDASIAEVLGRASGKIWKLVCVSLLTALGIGFGLLLLVVPAFILATRWAVSVPVAMLEEGNARDALRRSREVVRGNGWNVFKVLFAVGLLTAVVQIPFMLAAAGSGPFGWWLATTTASALTAPYAAHALTVVYYTLVQPGRPVVLDPGQRWKSVWAEQEVTAEPDPERTAWDEYEARFDERDRRFRA